MYNKQTKFDQIFLGKTLPVFAIIVILLWTYWPSLYAAYDYHDSFYSFVSTTKNVCRGQPQHAFFFFLGRPLYALLNCYTVSAFIYSIDDTIFVRGLNFLVFLASALFAYDLLRRVSISALPAAAIVVCGFTLPGFQLFIFVTQAGPILWSLPFIFLAVAIFIASGERLERFWSSLKDFALVSLAVVLSGISLIIASMVYQQTTSLFFIFLCLYCLHRLPRVSPGTLATIFAVGVAAYGFHGILYIIIHKLYILPIGLEYMGKSAESMAADARNVAFTVDIRGKLAFIWNFLLPKGTRLWTVGIGHPLAQLVTWSTPIALILWVTAAVNTKSGQHAGEDRKTTSWLSWLIAFVILLLTLVFVNAPNLVAQGSSIAMRHVLPFHFMIVTVLIMGAWGAFQLFGNRGTTIAVGVAVGLSLFAAMETRANLDRNMAGLAIAEFKYIKDAIAEKSPTPPKRILVIQPTVQSLALAPDLIDTYDEIGKLTTMYWQDVRWIVLAAGMAAGIERGKIPAAETATPEEAEAARSNPEALIIDMRKFAWSIINRRLGVSGALQ